MFFSRWYVMVIFLIWIIVSWFVAEEFQRIAAIKGFYESRYFWWCFLFGPIGWLMVIALPDHSYNAFEADHSEPYETNNKDDALGKSQWLITDDRYLTDAIKHFGKIKV